MLSRIIKILLFLGTLSFSIFQFIEFNIGNGIFLSLISGLFVLFYFKNEFIIIAFWYVRKQNLEKADKWLNKIRNPETTLSTNNQRGYYYFLKGIIESQKNMNTAEKLFKKALAFGLRYDHDKAMIKLQLAALAIQRRRKTEATTLINEAKKLDKRGLMKEQINMVKAGLKRI